MSDTASFKRIQAFLKGLRLRPGFCVIEHGRCGRYTGVVW